MNKNAVILERITKYFQMLEKQNRVVDEKTLCQLIKQWMFDYEMLQKHQSPSAAYRAYGHSVTVSAMNTISAAHTAQLTASTINEEKKRTMYGKHNGHNQWDLAKDYFQMSNDAFFDHYGFNFVPRGRLYKEAKSFLESQINVSRGW
ncbi:hypothetical protein U2I54_16190 [Bacillus pseudomycoides]|uniref:Phage protein n=1 Tax=Bacillus bingmayongensis TaxID=1150157 RepID=A0ABU5JZM7_9BACI|nr:hypothetical protein [Bacillus pseudomycoides]